MMTIEVWCNLLKKLTENTDYDVIMKDQIKKPVVAIVPKWRETPQRIAIYPKKTKNAGLVLEDDIYSNSRITVLAGDADRIHSNRPHFNHVEDEVIIEICKIFLMKD